MSISSYPSTVAMPQREKPYPAIIDFLSQRFPNIDKSIWEKRIKSGKILDENGRKIDFLTPYSPGKKLHYFREVENEKRIPFKEKIIYEDSHILIVDKPHFLPVIPSGQYVNECLLNRLKKATKKPDLTPVNRIDRETAGLVLFSTNTETRGLYHELFKDRKITKVYEAITESHSPPDFSERIIENRLSKGSPWFRMQIEKGEVNSVTSIEVIKIKENLTHFRLSPVTGKKHQLRVHLSSIGYNILNDLFYPVLHDKKDDDYSKPLQLLAKKLIFNDPVTGEKRSFSSRLSLSYDWEQLV